MDGRARRALPAGAERNAAVVTYERILSRRWEGAHERLLSHGRTAWRAHRVRSGRAQTRDVEWALRCGIIHAERRNESRRGARSCRGSRRLRIKPALAA